MLRLSELRGLWRRSLIAWPDGRQDTTSKVQWLQGVGTFGDLRQSSQLSPFTHVRSLRELSRLDCEVLAQQQAFAGHLTFDGQYFEWHRHIDFQPDAPHPDVGSLRWERNVLIEEGRDARYIEHWHRVSDTKVEPLTAGALLQHRQRGTAGIVVRVAEHLMFARDRSIALSKCKTLMECFQEADGVDQIRAMIDCEISFAAFTSSGFRIYASSLPFRVGEFLPRNLNTEWEVKKSEGAVAALGL